MLKVFVNSKIPSKYVSELMTQYLLLFQITHCRFEGNLAVDVNDPTYPFRDEDRRSFAVR